MCLAVPARVMAIQGRTARVDLEGNERDCSIDVVPEVEVGDYVLMHAGYAMQIIRDEDAEETLRLLREACRAEDPDGLSRSSSGAEDPANDPAPG